MKTKTLRLQFLRISFLAVFISLISLFSCKKNLEDHVKSSQLNMSKTITAGVVGKVLYEDGTPASNVKVEFAGFAKNTNADGEFDFDNVTCPEKDALVSVHINGYFPAYRSFNLKPDTKEYTLIRLLKKEISKSFVATEKAVVDIRGGGTISFEPYSLVDEKTGVIYAGQVDIYSAWIDPSKTTLYEFLPGSLRGTTLGNNEVNLESYGMIAVEMYDANGRKLQLGKNKTANIELPIPSNMVQSAPESIPLWSLNEETGVWKEEAIANKVGDKYVGNATHFSFWNLDVPGAIGLTVTLVDSLTNNPIPFRTIRITRLLNNTTRMGNTNNNGEAIGYVLPNENYVFEVLFLCGGVYQVVKSFPFSMGSVAQNLGNIQIYAPGSTMVATGLVVDANNNPMPNTIITFKPTMNAFPIKVTTDNSGQFSYSTISCVNSLNVIATAYDDVNLINSGPITFTLTPGIQNLGTIQASGSLSEYVKVSKVVSGISTDYRIAEPNMNANCYYNNNASFMNVNSFSNQVGIDWRFNFRINGPIGIQGPHQMSFFYELINGQTNITNAANTIIDPSITFIEYGTAMGSIFSGRKEVKLSNNTTRILDFRLRKDN